MKKFIIPLLVVLLFSNCKTKPAAPTGLITEKAMVVSAREEASKIGVEIMKKGGNAFDAMVAMEMSLVVAYPFAGSIGGGGFMVYRKADGTIGGIDYRGGNRCWCTWHCSRNYRGSQEIWKIILRRNF